MKKFILKKNDLKTKNWNNIFSSFDNDTEHIAKYFKLIVKEKNIPIADLDSMLYSISSHVTTHIECSSSGLKFV